MRSMLLAFSTILLACLPFAATAHPPGENSNLVNSAKQIEKQSQSQLGVGVRAISLLFAASPHNFQPMWSLESDGTWPLIENLQAKGYIMDRSRFFGQVN